MFFKVSTFICVSSPVLTAAPSGAAFFCYDEAMPDQKKTIVAIHGAGMHAGVWESLPLAAESLSLPGHAGTTGALLPSIEEMSAWVMQRLEGAPAGSVVLMGHSMGALVALEAARHSAVAALVLMGAAAKMPVHPDLLRQATEAPDAAAGMILKWGISSSRPDADVFRHDLKRQMQPETLFNDLKACDEYRHGEAVAKEIDKPALLIAGEDDKLTKPADAKILAGILPQGQFHVLSGCGHMPIVEQPAALAAVIRHFVLGLR